MNIKKSTLLLLSICFISGAAMAQNTIEQQYQEFYEKSNTWEDFKVIKLYRMDEFWSVVSDTIKDKRATISSLNLELDSLNHQVSGLKSTLGQTEEQLVESRAMNESISFLGIQFSKTVYNIIVWAIIGGLIGGLVTVYLMFKQSNITTRKTKKDYDDLEKENQEIRQKARDTQIKLKRELQTALNRLSEQRV